MKRDEFSVTRPALDLTDIDFARFGITGIRVMRGTDIMQTWTRRAAPELRAASAHHEYP
jgi:hypothetical protein